MPQTKKIPSEYLKSLECIVNTFKDKGFRVFFDMQQVKSQKLKSEKGKHNPITLTINRSPKSMKPSIAYKQALYQLLQHGIEVSPRTQSREYGRPVFDQSGSSIESYDWMSEIDNFLSEKKVCGNVFFRVRYITNARGRVFSFTKSQAFDAQRYNEL